MSDQNTKTYPLSAIMGGEISDKERIAELTDAFNRVCDENADFVSESIKTDRRIAELAAQLKHAEGYAGELEADSKDLYEDIKRLTNEAYKREAQLKHAREDAERYRWMRERHENTIMDIYNSISPAMIKPELLDAAIDAERKGK
jgi:chromosome segregation ATPase